MAKTSDAQQAATKRYIAKNYDTIRFYVKIGGKEALKNHALTHDSSLTAFLHRAIRQTMADDGADAETVRAICGDDHS